MVDRVREWLCVIRPKTLSECARQMKYVLSRDDLMLKNSEYDALERASVIIAGLAAFQPTAREERLVSKCGGRLPEMPFRAASRRSLSLSLRPLYGSQIK